MVWNPLDQPVDYVILGGQRTPGIATIEGLSSPRKWDERRGYALSGSTVVFRGIGLSSFKIKIRLYTTADWKEWDTFRPIVQRPPRNTTHNPEGDSARLFDRPRALAIQHPFAEQAGVAACVVTDLSAPEQTGDGEWTITISMLEFRRPQRALANIAGSDNQLTPAQREQAELMVELAGDTALANLARVSGR